MIGINLLSAPRVFILTRLTHGSDLSSPSYLGCVLSYAGDDEAEGDLVFVAFAISIPSLFSVIPSHHCCPSA